MAADSSFGDPAQRSGKAGTAPVLAEEALRESEKRYRAVVEDTPAMICRLLRDGTLTFVNSFFCSYYTKYKEDLIGYNFFDLFPPASRDAVRAHFDGLTREAPMKIYEHRVARPNGIDRWEEWTNRALYDEQGQLTEYQSIGRDITEQKQAQDERAKLERQIQQAQKIEAVGTLAAGIAHDFNNILSAVIGHSELSLLYLPKGSQAQQNIKKILEATERARELVNLIQLIGIETEPTQKPVRVQLVLKEVLKLMRASLPASVEIHQQLAAESAAVLCDPTQIHQVLMNLCSNAKHSMTGTGGTLTVSLREVDIPANPGDAPADLEPGPFIRLEVADTGEGMDRKTLERIFDPYFTTKEKGIGTGLGLAVVRGIIKKYGGSIHATSQPGKGTAFTVFLPRLSEPESNAVAVTGAMPSGSETLLLVDDEEALVELGCEMLKNLGYSVQCHTNPIQALEAFRLQPGRFDLVITDMSMPQMTGAELARNLLGIRSDIPIVLCTGFNDGLSNERANTIGIKVLAMKPMEMRDLAHTIRRVLDEARRSGPIR